MAATRAVAITYVPADCGSIIPGKSKAPAAFRSAGLVPKLHAAGLSTTEHHALPAPAVYAPVPPAANGIRNEDANVEVCHAVREAVGRSLAGSGVGDGKGEGGELTVPPFQLVVGGECSMLPGVLTAFNAHTYPSSLSSTSSTATTSTSTSSSSQPPPTPTPRIGLLYIDADADLLSPSDPTSTGVFAGMNMTHLTRLPGSLPSMTPFTHPTTHLPLCSGSNTAFFGLNTSSAGNTTPQTLARLFDGGFRVFSAAGVAADPEGKAREVLEWMEERVDVLVVHLDVDAIDPGEFPLANVPSWTGVGFGQMMRALRVVLGSGMVGGLVVAEVNPDHDPGLGLVERLVGEVVGMLGERKGA